MNAKKPNDLTIFNAALEISDPSERKSYVEEACGGDAALRDKIASLLEAYERAGDSFDRYGGSGALTSRQERSDLETTGTMIGRYKLLQKIGEGGCGVVYMAEQEEPVRRRVALKIIKLGMDTKNVIARFEAERQALAMMDHANIAKVLDAGSTENGRPYFVMELVRGTKITDYCDEKQLSTQGRLKLFSQVCHAVQHAHQKGIIHRDLKPSNILVSTNDGISVPKVIDFGIAKATTDQRLTDKTVFTAFEQFIGTPAYMSPEQAEVTNVDIDTRSDIYSLGVLLYELLTGKTPFDQSELLQAGLDAMRRTIREKEPARPSTRVSTLGADELTTASKRRGLEPAKLVNVLRGDLDWIAMKCLEKDRARRYETANGLAMDIQRHLSNEPVVACPPSVAYRFHKMLRRNKVVFAAGAGTAAALMIGLAVALWQFVEKTRAYEKAQTEAAKNQEAGQILEGMLHNLAPALPRDTKTITLNEISSKLTAWFQKGAERGDPKSETVLGLLYSRGVGVPKDPVKAVFWYRKAADQGFANAQCNLGFMFEHGIGVGKDLAEAARWYRKGADQANAGAQNNLALMYQSGDGVAKNPTEAVRLFRLAANQGNPSAQRALGAAYYDGSGVAEDAAEAVRWFRKAAEQGDAQGEFDLGLMYYQGKGVAKDLQEAIKWWKRATEHGDADACRHLAQMYERGEGVIKDWAEARKWRQKATESGEAVDLNNLGWQLATCPHPEARDGRAAVIYAEKAVAATSRTNAFYLDTLAAANAEAGDFVKAVTIQKEAIALSASEAEKNDYASRLKLYESKTPYRQSE